MRQVLLLLALAAGVQAPVPYQAPGPGAVSRTVQDKLSESVSVKDFGACGNGRCDDTGAFQRAVNTGAGRIRIPVGSYRLTRPLNLTGIHSGPLILFGDGWGSDGAGSSILCDTGTVCIDASGAAFVTIEDLAISPGHATPSTVGILFARTVAARYSSFNGLRNVRIHLRHNAEANGGAGTIGIYNLACENWKYQGGLVYADIPIVFSATNIYNVSSSYTALLGGYQSMSVVELSGSIGLVAFGGPALKILGAANLHFGNTYMLSERGNAFEFAMAIDSTQGLEHSGSIEGFRRLLTTTTRLEGIVLRSRIVPVAGKSVIDLDGTQAKCCAALSKSDIRLQLGASSDNVHDLVNTRGPKAWGIEQSFLSLQPKETITIGSGHADYNIFQTPNPLASIRLPRHGTGTANGNIIQASDGVSVGDTVHSNAGLAVDGKRGVTASGKSCTVTAVTGGIVTGVSCKP